MRLTIVLLCLFLLSCGGGEIKKKQSKIDDLIKKRTEVEATKKIYVDSVAALKLPDDKFMEYNREYNKAKEWNRIPEIPKDLYRLWKKLDELDNDIEAYNENVLTLSQEIDESKKK